MRNQNATKFFISSVLTNFKSFLRTSTTTTKDGLEGFNAYNNNNENDDNIHEDILIVAGYSYANVILEYFTQCPII